MKFGEYYFENIRTDADGFIVADVSLALVQEIGVIITSSLYKNMRFYSETHNLDTTLFDKISFSTFKLLLLNQ